MGETLVLSTVSKHALKSVQITVLERSNLDLEALWSSIFLLPTKALLQLPVDACAGTFDRGRVLYNQPKNPLAVKMVLLKAFFQRYETSHTCS